jgi:hypothetical protein
MQHNLAQLEYDRAMAAQRPREARPRVEARSRSTRAHEPSRQRAWAAATLARLAWRLDPKAALRVWP